MRILSGLLALSFLTRYPGDVIWSNRVLREE